jgi:hypothetical protein
MKTKSCGIYGCQEDLIWGLIRPDGKLSRFSFSKNLLEWLNRQYLNGECTVTQFKFRKGRRLEIGEQSASGIYAITAEKGSIGRTLRACYTAEQAAFLADPGTRSIHEFWLISPPNPLEAGSPSPSPRPAHPSLAHPNHARQSVGV